MRTPFVAGNWKMNKTVAESRQLVSEMVPLIKDIKGVEIVLCPPFTSLLASAALLEGTDIGLGAQNLHWEPSGAYTGEVSAKMVAELCRYVILGHSERRAYFGETDELVGRKLSTAMTEGLIPIFCVGETLAENEAGMTAEVVTRQLQKGLEAATEGRSSISSESMVIAYEPVWAIGTGKAATVADAAKVIGEVIRPTLSKLVSSNFAQGVRVLYGGSVTSSNAAEFFQDAEIDGALVGGASLKVADFIQIVRAAIPRVS